MNMKDLNIEKILRENLPNQLEFTGEFGSEIGLFIPFLRFLDRYDCLLDRKIITYSGMEIFYKASNLPIPDIKYEKRKFLYSHELMPWLPIWNIHSYNNGIKSIFHDFPNYRNYFESIDFDVNSFFKDERPLIIIFNKVVEEDILKQAKQLVSDANPDHPDIANKLFSDMGSNFEFEQSLRPFHSTPSTTIPNDQGAFAEFCYGSMISCKEGNEFARIIGDINFEDEKFIEWINNFM